MTDADTDSAHLDVLASRTYLECGRDGWWCHTACFRYETCQYTGVFHDEPTEEAPKAVTLDDILTEHCRRAAR